jgi:hypothetical protein
MAGGARMISIVDFLGVAHQWAYSSGRHRDAIRITARLVELRGLQPRRAEDRRCDVQFDHDEELEFGWAP